MKKTALMLATVVLAIASTSCQNWTGKNDRCCQKNKNDRCCQKNNDNCNKQMYKNNCRCSSRN